MSRTGGECDGWVREGWPKNPSTKLVIRWGLHEPLSTIQSRLAFLPLPSSPPLLPPVTLPRRDLVKEEDREDEDFFFSFFFPNFIAKKQLRIAYLKKKDQNFILSSNHRHLDNNSFDIHQSKPRQSNRRTTLHRLLRYPPRVVSFSTLEGGKSVSLKLGRSVKSEIVGKH